VGSRELVEAEVVCYLRKQSAIWEERRQHYVSKGNNGPYLGGPSYSEMASDIEKGKHRVFDDAIVPLVKWEWLDVPPLRPNRKSNG